MSGKKPNLSEEQIKMNIEHYKSIPGTNLDENKRTVDNSVSHCIVVTGIPGSGKTTIAENLCASGDYMKIETDDFSGHNKAKSFYCAIRAALSDKKNIVVCAVFGTTKQCAELVDIMDAFHGKVRLDIVHLLIEKKLAIERAKRRRNHPTVNPTDASVIVSIQFARAKWDLMDAVGTHHTINVDPLTIDELLTQVRDVTLATNTTPVTPLDTE
jgi:adenylate kinase family enzyme